MNRSFTDPAFFIRTDYSQVNLTGAETPERVQSALVLGGVVGSAAAMAAARAFSTLLFAVEPWDPAAQLGAIAGPCCSRRRHPSLRQFTTAASCQPE